LDAKRALQRVRPRSANQFRGHDLGQCPESPGTSLPIERFFIAKPSYPAFLMNIVLGLGFNLILTPGIYHLDGTLLFRAPTRWC